MGASQRGHRAGGARRGAGGGDTGRDGDGPQVGPTPAAGLAPATGRGAGHGQRRPAGRARRSPPRGPFRCTSGAGHENPRGGRSKGARRDGTGRGSGAIRNKGAWR